MSRRVLLALVVLLLLLAGRAAAEPCASGARTCDDRAVPGAALERALPAPLPPGLGEGGPSLLAALLRMLGAVLVLTVLMALGVLGYRRLVQRAGMRSGGVLAWAASFTDDSSPDAVRVGSRRHLGGHESVAVIHAGGERFLVGITVAQISLLARLEPADAAPDFTATLARATAPPASSRATEPEHVLRVAVDRSRARLRRLAHLSLVPRDDRG
jgi:flagellar biogenesis protein FliO